jgi:nucleosome-remodeling factor subunit BPTF
LPINKPTDSNDVKESSTSQQGQNSKTVNSKQTPEEIKEKMEQQLKIQRAAHHQKRQMEMKQGN